MIRRAHLVVATPQLVDLPEKRPTSQGPLGHNVEEARFVHAFAVQYFGVSPKGGSRPPRAWWLKSTRLSRRTLTHKLTLLFGVS